MGWELKALGLSASTQQSIWLLQWTLSLPHFSSLRISVFGESHLIDASKGYSISLRFYSFASAVPSTCPTPHPPGTLLDFSRWQ